LGRLSTTAHNLAGSAILVLALTAIPGPASAQDTRAAVLEQRRAEKAKQLEPYRPNRLEKLLLVVDAENPIARIAPHNGFFVEYGYSHKPVGSGVGFGGGYRHDLFDRRARVELEEGISFSKYQLLRADFSLPYLADDRFEVGIEATYHHHPKEDFYGLGSESREDDRVSYLFDNRRIEGRAVVRPRDGLEFGTRLGLMNPSVGAGRDKNYPSLELVFDDAGAPGLVAQPDFTYTDLYGAVDYRDQPGNARTGGYYTVTWRRMSDSDADRYGFGTVDARIQQFFPIFDKKRVFAVQARVITTHPRDGQQVPFYLKPTIGGSHSVRSLSDYRFRDDNVMFFNVEYRWEAFGILDMALFTDWGTVASRPGDLDFGDLKRGYGIGFRFNTPKAVFFRVDIATGGGEGVKFLTKFSKMF
jgi:outer membrane protein assembly factor BamA